MTLPCSLCRAAVNNFLTAEPDNKPGVALDFVRQVFDVVGIGGAFDLEYDDPEPVGDNVNLPRFASAEDHSFFIGQFLTEPDMFRLDIRPL